MQRFKVTVAGNKLTAQDIEQAIYNAITELSKEDIIVVETK